MLSPKSVVFKAASRGIVAKAAAPQFITRSSPEAAPQAALTERQRLQLPSSAAATISFSVYCHVPFGTAVFITGDCDQLGNWDAAHGLKMNWNEGDIWTASARFKPGSQVDFEYVMAEYDSGTTELVDGANFMIEVPETSEEFYETQAKAKAHAKVWLHDEEEKVAARPTVRVTLRNAKVDQGDIWKLAGEAPELGHHIKEVAPYMSTQDGNDWVYEGKMRHGSHIIQALLRHRDMSYWTEGPTGVLEVPPELGPNDVVELSLTL